MDTLMKWLALIAAFFGAATKAFQAGEAYERWQERRQRRTGATYAVPA